MGAIWKGSISFGLVSIAVSLYPATEERDVAFHQVHRADGGRIRYRRVCTRCDREVDYADIAKGYELADGELVVLTDDDLAGLPLSTSREIEVLEFVPLEQVDPIYFAKTYYVEPDVKARKPYVLLREALEKSGRIGIVKVALRRRESLATLRVRDNVLVLETMFWPDEIRQTTFDVAPENVKLRPQEIAMAESLIESLSSDFGPSRYRDEYRAALEKVIEAKVEGRDVVRPAERPASNVVDLVAALRASVEAAQRERRGGRRSRTTPAPTAQKSARPAGTRRSRARTTQADAPTTQADASTKQTGGSAKKPTARRRTA